MYTEVQGENREDELAQDSILDEHAVTTEKVNMANNWITTIIAVLVWIFLSFLNIYAIVQLGMSHGDIN